MTPLTLNTDQFCRMCSALGVPPQERGEKRRTERIQVRMPVQVAVVGGKGEILTPITSMLRDISMRGASLVHPSAIKPGSQMVFFLGDENVALRVLAHVVHSKCFVDGTALVGLEFIGFVDPSANRSKRPGMN